MKLTDYIKSNLPAYLCPLVFILIIDTILLVSSSLQKSLNDILYLNILLFAIYIVFFIYGYASTNSKYGKVRKALGENKNIDYLLPEDDSFYSVLLREAIQAKSSEQLALVSEYKNDMDELNNYIIKWVHEVKIPISVSELMLENNNELEIDTSRKFKTELERIKFLVNQVLYAGRAAHYHEDLTANDFSLQKVVREAMKLNAYFLMTKNIEVLPKDLDYTVVTDEKWVIYILEQLLNNASKYVRQDGRIEIFAEDNNKSVCLHIKDNGIGIPAKDIGRVFDKGFTGGKRSQNLKIHRHGPLLFQENRRQAWGWP